MFDLDNARRPVSHCLWADREFALIYTTEPKLYVEDARVAQW